jgi:type IV pilus assembly protein PilV
MRKPLKARHAKGFILLEAIIGILIFSLAILGIMLFQAASAKMTASARYQTEAAMLADELIARMYLSNKSTLGTDYAGSGTSNAFHTWLTTRVQGTAGLPNGSATISITHDSTTSTDAVNLTISWTPPGGDSGQYVTSALIY